MLRSFIQKFFVVVVLSTSLFSSAFAEEDYQVESPLCVQKLFNSDISWKQLNEAIHNSWNWPSIHYAIENNQFEVAEALIKIFPEEAALRTPNTKVVREWSNSSDWSYSSHHHEGVEEGISALELALMKNQPNLALTILQISDGAHANEHRVEFRGEFINSWLQETYHGYSNYTYEMIYERVKNVEPQEFVSRWRNDYIETMPLYWAMLSQDLVLTEALLVLNVDLKHVYISNQDNWNWQSERTDYDAIDIAACYCNLDMFRKVIFYQNPNKFTCEEEISDDDLQRLYEIVRKAPGRSLFQSIENNDSDSFQFLMSYGYGIDYLDRIDYQSGKSLFTIAWEHENSQFIEILRRGK